MHGKTVPSNIQLNTRLACTRKKWFAWADQRMCCPIARRTNNEKSAVLRLESMWNVFFYRRREKSVARKIMSELFPQSTNRTDDVTMLFASPEQIQTPLVIAWEDVFSFLFHVCLINTVFTYPQICLISIWAVIVMGMCRVSTCGDWRSHVSDFWTVFIHDD